jgi:hypothetical protein
MNEKEKIELYSFGCVSTLRIKRENRARCLRGVAKLFRESLQHRLKVINNEMTDFIWISLTADIGKEGKISTAVCYNLPKKSICEYPHF